MDQPRVEPQVAQQYVQQAHMLLVVHHLVQLARLEDTVPLKLDHVHALVMAITHQIILMFTSVPTANIQQVMLFESTSKVMLIILHCLLHLGCSSACTNCNAGYTSVAPASSCSQCSPGQYSPSAGYSYCPGVSAG
jgi:hypothetical protein